MRLLWYWPHPLDGVAPIPTLLAAAGVDTTVQAIGELNGRELGVDGVDYRLVRDLPQVGGRGHGVGRALDGFRRRVVRQHRRNRLIRRLRPDVVHIELIEPEFDWLTIPLARRRSGSATVGVVHDVISRDSRFPRIIESRLFRTLYGPRHFDLLVVYHQFIADQLVNRFAVDPERVAVLPHPIPEPEQRPRRRRTADDSFNVLFLGSIRSDKGVSVIDAAIRGRAPRDDLEFTFAGRGETALEVLVERLAADRPDVEATIGVYDRELKRSLLRSADLVVLPYTTFESQSGVLGDAYEFGVPVVASDVGAVGPTVRSDGTGWVVPPGDATALREAIELAAADRDAYDLVRDNVRRAAERHAPAAITDQLRSIYERAATLR